MSPHPDPEPLWTTADIAQRLGLSQERARQIANSESFPAPSYRHGMARFWMVVDVERWIAEHRPGNETEGGKDA